MLYAKASDPRMSAGDHELQSVPLHMDIHQLQASVKPERWLDPQNKLDMAVSVPQGLDRSVCIADADTEAQFYISCREFSSSKVSSGVGLSE